MRSKNSKGSKKRMRKRSFLQAVCCLVSLVVRLCFSHLISLLLFSASSTNLYTVSFHGEISGRLRARSSLASNSVLNVVNPTNKIALVRDDSTRLGNEGVPQTHQA
ncbi:putative beta-xylosyltransferase irx14h-like protein [Sesbania bispinosa]|nr:putative beta-xylosyltransferase irx14h-like protein [Sesbania bispinosa]